MSLSVAIGIYSSFNAGSSRPILPIRTSLNGTTLSNPASVNFC